MKARTAAASAGRAGGRGALLSPRVPADPGGIPSRPPPRAAAAVERTHLRFFPRRSFLQNTRTPPGARNAPAAVTDGEKNCISERRGEEKVEGFPRGNSPGFSLLLPLLFFSFSKQHKKNEEKLSHFRSASVLSLLTSLVHQFFFFAKRKNV
jgi:hypothetical protein